MMQLLSFIQNEIGGLAPLWSSTALTFVVALHFLAAVLVSPTKQNS